MIIEADGTLKISEEELAEVERTTFSLIQEPSNQNVQRTRRCLNKQYASDSEITRTVVSPDKTHRSQVHRSAEVTKNAQSS